MVDVSWNIDTMLYGYFTNDQVNWITMPLKDGRNYNTSIMNYGQFKYAMFPPNSVVYLYNNLDQSSLNYYTNFVGAYYASANNGNYNSQPIDITGIKVIDFHSNNSYINYCSCADNNVTCENQGFIIDVNNNNCIDSIPATLPAPTYFATPSTTWIWIVVAVLSFCCLLVFVFIILMFVGVFKFGKHQGKKENGAAEENVKKEQASTKSKPLDDIV